jgi:putative redox protein
LVSRSEKETAMQVTYDGDMRFVIRDRGHEIVVDSPEREGDAGLGPTEIFAGSVGACLGYYALAYCRKYGLDATGLRVEIEKDFALNPRRITRIAAKIVLPAHIGPEHFAGIEAYARHCILHHTLQQPPELPLVIVNE